jgi:hypothetical protein
MGAECKAHVTGVHLLSHHAVDEDGRESYHERRDDETN